MTESSGVFGVDKAAEHAGGSDDGPIGRRVGDRIVELSIN
jgi:hypothetical protein